MNLTVGIDESGTGAWAGPFYVVAVLIDDPETFTRKCKGLLNDSKKLSDEKRREAVPLIEEHALGIFRFAGVVDEIRSKGMKAVWREGVSACLHHYRKDLPSVVIDGVLDRQVTVPSELKSVTWEKKADAKYPAVMAASIIAKTCRNDDMIRLSKEYPLYGWYANSGYGTAHHQKMIDKYGLTPHHRPIQGLNVPNTLSLFSDPTIDSLFDD